MAFKTGPALGSQLADMHRWLYSCHSLIAGGDMREFGHTDVDAKTRREDPKLAADDLDRWAFRKRFAAAHETSQLLWILLAIVGAFVVVLLVRIPSDHVSATSGSSEQSTLVREAPRRERVSASSSPTPERGPASSAIGTSSDMPMVYRCVGKPA